MNIQMPDTQKIEGEISVFVGGLSAFKIENNEDFNKAGLILKEIKRRQNGIKEIFEEPKKAANAAHKAITAAERKQLEPLENAERFCKYKMSAFLQAAAAEKALIEKKAREEAEAKAKKEAEDRRKIEDEERLRIAQELEAQGFTQEADQVLETKSPEIPVVPIVQKINFEAPKASGIHSKSKFRGEVFDLMMMVQEVAAGRLPLIYLQANQKLIDSDARSRGGLLSIPGVRVIEEKSVSVRVD